MQKQTLLHIILDAASAFFINLAAGFFFAIYVTKTIGVLLNNIIACIVCIVVAIYIATMKHNE
jgi:hypothetical protein